MENVGANSAHMHSILYECGRCDTGNISRALNEVVKVCVVQRAAHTWLTYTLPNCTLVELAPITPVSGPIAPPVAVLY